MSWLPIHTMPALCLALLATAMHPLQAQHPLQIELSGKVLQPGDTLRFACQVPALKGTNRIGSLQLWMQDLEQQNLWALRYPVLNGLSEGEVVLPTELPQGRYALWFQLQRQFFTVYGQITNSYRSDSIDYTLRLASNEMVGGRVMVDKQGKFRLPSHIFPGTATLYFSEVRKRQVNEDVNIIVSTPLDSAFTAVADTLLVITVGQPTANYAMEVQPESIKQRLELKGGTLQPVEVRGRKKSPIELFDEQVSSSIFRDPQARIIDLTETPLGFFANVFEYLNGRVAGLTVMRNPRNGGSYELRMRGGTPVFLLDEVPTTQDMVAMIPVSDIAMIKVFAHPSAVRSFVGGGGPVFAIYTHRGGDYAIKKFDNRFPVQGYTPLVYTLPLQTASAADELSNKKKK